MRRSTWCCVSLESLLIDALQHRPPFDERPAPSREAHGTRRGQARRAGRTGSASSGRRAGDGRRWARGAGSPSCVISVGIDLGDGSRDFGYPER